MAAYSNCIKMVGVTSEGLALQYNCSKLVRVWVYTSDLDIHLIGLPTCTLGK